MTALTPRRPTAWPTPWITSASPSACWPGCRRRSFTGRDRSPIAWRCCCWRSFRSTGCACSVSKPGAIRHSRDVGVCIERRRSAGQRADDAGMISRAVMAAAPDAPRRSSPSAATSMRPSACAQAARATQAAFRRRALFALLSQSGVRLRRAGLPQRRRRLHHRRCRSRRCCASLREIEDAVRARPRPIPSGGRERWIWICCCTAIRSARDRAIHCRGRSARRVYMLGPLAELAPDWRYPPSGPTIGELWRAFPHAEHLLAHCARSGRCLSSMSPARCCRALTSRCCARRRRRGSGR